MNVVYFNRWNLRPLTLLRDVVNQPSKYMDLTLYGDVQIF